MIPLGTKADLIEGALGEFSSLDEKFGIHADGSVRRNIILPEDADRLIPYLNSNTNGITGLCLERHDLCVAKLVANRDKDREFVGALLRAGIVEPAVILSRMVHSRIVVDHQQEIVAFVHASVAGSDQG